MPCTTLQSSIEDLANSDDRQCMLVSCYLDQFVSVCQTMQHWMYTENLVSSIRSRHIYVNTIRGVIGRLEV